MLTFSRSVRYASLSTVIIMLAGCSGSPSSLLGPARAQLAESRSWMGPNATSTDLLYISGGLTGSVWVYSYPRNKLVGTLTGFSKPYGECADKAGNVWIVDNGTSELYEYAHGGTSPIATLSDPYGTGLFGCSVDPTTGNLAVTSYGSNGIAIFQNAQGSPQLYTDSSLYTFYYCGYDNKGNLYADGDHLSSFAFQFDKLAKGSATFKTIVLGQSFSNPGNIQWDGKHVAVEDQNFTYPSSVIYQETRGGKGVGSTPLQGVPTVVQFWIHGHVVIGPTENNGVVGFWKYPQGGNPTKTLTVPEGSGGPFGAVISK